MLPEAEIGKNIRKLRRARGFTLLQLAKNSGLSKGYLSKVENATKAPAVSTLLNIAKALGVSVSAIFGENEGPTSFSLVKRDERQPMSKAATSFGYFYETLAHKYPNKHMEPYLLTIPKTTTETPLFQHKGEEMLMVLEGALRFFHGDDESLLEEGDCIYFDSGIPHRSIPVGDKDVKCLITIYST